MTEHGIEMQRTQGPFDLAICTQKQNIGIPHAKIGRFRTTWSSASMLKPVQVRVCRCAAICLSLLRLSTGLPHVQFILEGLAMGLVYSMIKNDSLSSDSIQVAGCDVTDVEEYQKCAGGVQIDVGTVNKEHVEGNTGKIMMGIAGGWFLLRTVTFFMSRVAMLELFSDGCPQDDAWIYFPGE